MRRLIPWFAGLAAVVLAVLPWVAHDRGAETRLPGVGPPRTTSPPRVLGALIQMEPTDSRDSPWNPPAIPQRWGRATPSDYGDHWPPNRADWSDEPLEWRLTPVAEVEAVPAKIRVDLEPHDCAVPSVRGSSLAHSLLMGEFERAGQEDVVLLCVHRDKTSAVYVYWAGDPARRETLPMSGSQISVVTRVDIQTGLNLDQPIDDDMPQEVTHDGIVVGCCECCSTIFYRHRSQWFTLHGGD
ncbi:MAG: hypothetical protein U0163_00080 [Gemmatimonadaceae bacterium]